MKLNPNCIRAILLTIEDTCDFDTPWEYDADDANYDFLANITNEPVWKKALEKGANVSLPVLIEIAKEVALKHFLG